jgi:hypothetical protein
LAIHVYDVSTVIGCSISFLVKTRNFSLDVAMKIIIICDITPCSLLSFNRRFGGTYCLHLQGRRNKFSKKPATSVETQRTIWRHIPEDDTLHNYHCGNLKSYIDVAMITSLFIQSILGVLKIFHWPKGNWRWCNSLPIFIFITF